MQLSVMDKSRHCHIKFQTSYGKNCNKLWTVLKTPKKQTSSLFLSLTPSGTAGVSQALGVMGCRCVPGHTGGGSGVPQTLHARHSRHTVQLLKESSAARRGEPQHIAEHQAVKASIHVHHPDTHKKRQRLTSSISKGTREDRERNEGWGRRGQCEWGRTWKGSWEGWCIKRMRLTSQKPVWCRSSPQRGHSVVISALGIMGKNTDHSQNLTGESLLCGWVRLEDCVC